VTGTIGSRPLGRTDLEFSTVVLGAAVFGNEQVGCDEREAARIVDVYRSAGGNTIDVAPLYGDGVAETIVGNLLQGQRDQWVVCTKVGMWGEADESRRGLSAKKVTRGVEESLRRLRTDYIDLFQLHTVDPTVPIEETLEALATCVQEGKVRHIGCSNFDAWRMIDAVCASERAGYPPIASAQLRYSLVSREIEREHLPACDAKEISALAFAPLGAGALTGKIRRGAAPPPDSRVATSPRYASSMSGKPLEIIETLVELADAQGIPPAQLALAWVMNRPVVTATIVGLRSEEQAHETLGALDWTVDHDVLNRLSEVSRESLGYPYDLVREQYDKLLRNPGDKPGSEVFSRAWQ